MNSFINFIVFIVTVIIYFMYLKPKLTLETMNNSEKYAAYMSSFYSFLAIFMLINIVIQFILNSYLITDKCGGNLTNNLGQAGIFTFVPWTLLFGAFVLMLIVYPGIKSVFSDIVGYYFVSSKMNNLLIELLNNNTEKKMFGGDITIENPIKKQPNIENSSFVSDALIKILGNTSLIINQIVPSNFNQYWEVLKPLMKSKYQNESLESNQLKNNFFELACLRENVGEATWYIYMGVVLISIIQYNIMTRKCFNNTQTMTTNYKKFVESEQKNTNENNDNTVYKITS